MRIMFTLGLLAVGITLLLMAGCGDDGGSGGSNSSSNSNSSASADLAVSVRIDDTTSFINLVDGESQTSLTNANGVEVASGSAVYAYNDYVYATGSISGDKLTQYAVQSDNTLVEVAQTTLYESGGSIPTSLTFVDETKAYLPLAGTGELLSINLSDLTISNRIDLSAYALDANLETGGTDTNPEPSGAVIRNNKLYLALSQIDSFTTYMGRGVASVVIIDVQTDEVLSHITDERASTSGVLSPNHGLILDENGDIYLNNSASFGYYPNQNGGYLRINNGEDEFDPDYYFSITNLTGLDVAGGVASYAYNDIYGGNGLVYTTLFIPALTSNPPDYANDKNYQPYVLDLYNQTATKLDMPPTIGWSTDVVEYKGDIIFGLTTENGSGLYRAGESAPFLTTEGTPYFISNLQ